MPTLAISEDPNETSAAKGGASSEPAPLVKVKPIFRVTCIHKHNLAILTCDSLEYMYIIA